MPEISYTRRSQPGRYRLAVIATRVRPEARPVTQAVTARLHHGLRPIQMEVHWMPTVADVGPIQEILQSIEPGAPLVHLARPQSPSLGAAVPPQFVRPCAGYVADVMAHMRPHAHPEAPPRYLRSLLYTCVGLRTPADQTRRSERGARRELLGRPVDHVFVAGMRRSHQPRFTHPLEAALVRPVSGY